MQRRLSLESLEGRRLLTVGPLRLETVVSGLSNPVVATHANDGSERLFVAEQGGLVHIVRDGQRLARPFLDVASQLVTGGASGERGLLGLAFHPDYAVAGADGERLFYVYYSAPSVTGDHDSVVSEFRVSPTDPDLADPLSERSILRFNQPFSNHNGGDLKFGPDDGLLYISSGDGGSGGDPLGHGQNGKSLLGAILRIDVGGDDFPDDATRNYSIPPTNPFVNDQDVRDEIFALGLRNPFRMSFDDGPSAAASPDRLFTGDVGQNTFEEVDIIHAGGNYGWNVCEGDHVFNRPNTACPAQFVPPIAEYRHNEGISVIGGSVYRGTRFPSLEGVYLFGDLNGTLMALQEQTEGTFQRSIPLVNGTTASSIIAFGEDEAGEMYLMTFDRVLSISADVVLDASGNVIIESDGSDIVIRTGGEEVLRRDASSVRQLTVRMSDGDDQVSLANLGVNHPEAGLQIEFGPGVDTLNLVGAGHSIDLTTTSTHAFGDLETIQLVGDGASTLVLDQQTHAGLTDSNNVLRLIHDANDTVRYGEGWTAEQPTIDQAGLLHQLTQATARIEILNTRPFLNPLERYEVDRDGDVGALDALKIINKLQFHSGPLSVPNDVETPFLYLDVSSDGSLGAIDALQVINELARRLAAQIEAQIIVQWELRTSDAFYSPLNDTEAEAVLATLF